MWDERYGSEDYLFGTEPNQFLAGRAHLIPPAARVLAVADGEGRNGVFLAGQGHRVTAVDNSRVGLAKAHRLAADRGVELALVEADLLTWDWPVQAFDAVVAIFIQFASPAARRAVFERCWDALVPGGVFLLEGYRVEQLDYGTGGPPIADHLYTEDQLREELAAFEITALDCYDDEIHEGSGHDGMSALVDVVARRPD